MKKLLSLFALAAVASFGLASCSSDDEKVIDLKKAREEAKKAVDDSNLEEEAERLMKEIEEDM